MSTPIQDIPNDPNANYEEDAQLVDSLMKELNPQPPQQQFQQQQQQQQFQQMPEMVPQMQQPGYYNPYDAQAPQEFPQSPVPAAPRPQPRAGPQPGSFAQRMWSEAKGPIIVLALAVLFGLPTLDRILGRFLPRLVTEAGSMNLFGVLTKAVLLALAFFIIAKLVK